MQHIFPIRKFIIVLFLCAEGYRDFDNFIHSKTAIYTLNRALCNTKLHILYIRVYIYIFNIGLVKTCIEQASCNHVIQIDRLVRPFLLVFPRI
jgi:hypothetical protein